MAGELNSKGSSSFQQCPAHVGEIGFPHKLLAMAPVGQLITAHLTQDG